MRQGVALSLPLACALLSASAVEARSGAVFIHGAGSASLAGEPLARAYWSEDMIRAATRNYSVPHLVAHYDGTQYMWVAAGQVAGQIYPWMMANGVDDIVVNTHSFGGTVIRWIMSNPTWDWRYPAIIGRIRWVNAIAGPHRGSEAANLAGTLSGSWLTGWLMELLGTNTNAIKNCRTDWMASYNGSWLKGTPGRPPLPRTVYTIAGTGLWNDFIHSEDYGLATLSGIAGMPGEDDGMVSQYSAQGLGVVWFTTAANHHHNRRNDYRAIGDALGGDFALSPSSARALARDARAAGEPPSHGAFPEGERYLPPPASAPAQVSRSVVRVVALEEGRARFPLPVAAGKRLVLWTRALPSAATLSLRAPSGRVLAAGEAAEGGLRSASLDEPLPLLDLPGSHRAYLLEAPEGGVYEVELHGAAEGRAAVVVAAAQPESALTLTTWASPLARRAGEPVTVTAVLADGGVPLRGAHVTARLAPPEGPALAALRLHDDGRHGDGAAGDGVYAARFEAPASLPGLWTVRVDAHGRDARGGLFARTGGSGSLAESAGAQLVPGSIAATLEGRGGQRVLRVSAEAEVAMAGRYRLDALVAGAATAEGAHAALAWAEAPHTLEPGRARLSLELPLERGAEGERLLLDLTLLALDPPATAGRAHIELQP